MIAIFEVNVIVSVFHHGFKIGHHGLVVCNFRKIFCATQKKLKLIFSLCVMTCNTTNTLIGLSDTKVDVV